MKVKVLFEFTEQDRRALPQVLREHQGKDLMSYTDMKEWVVNLVTKRCEHARKRAASMQTQLVFQELREKALKAREMAEGASTPQELMEALSAVEKGLQELNQLGDTSGVTEFTAGLREEQVEGVYHPLSTPWEEEDLLEEEEGAEETE